MNRRAWRRTRMIATLTLWAVYVGFLVAVALSNPPIRWP